MCLAIIVHPYLAYWEGSLMLPYQAIFLLKKLNKPSAKCFRVSVQLPWHILVVLDFWVPALTQSVPLVCVISVSRGWGEFEWECWGACLQTHQLVGGRNTSWSILRSDRWVIAGGGQCSSEAEMLCRVRGWSCLCSSRWFATCNQQRWEPDLLFVCALLAEPLKCFPSANP